VTARVNSAEGGTNGTLVSVSNSGGTSGDPWYYVDTVTGTTCTFATAAAYKGSIGYRVAYSNKSGFGFNLRWNLAGWPQLRYRRYFRTSAYPTVSTQMTYVSDGTNTKVLSRIILLTNGKIGLQDYTGTTVFTSAAAIPLNTWIRVEWILLPGTTATNGVLQFAYATGDAAATETYADTSANTGTAGTMAQLYEGKLAGVWQSTTDYDDFAADDASSTTFLGASGSGAVVVDPTPPPPVAPIVVAPDQFTQAIRNSLRLSYSATATYDNAPVAGASDLRPTGGTITDTSKPGVRRVLNLDLAGGDTLFEALSPTGTLLTVSCTVTYTDNTTAVIPMGVFDIDSDRLSEGDGTISVTAPDKWVRIQRAKFLTPVSSTPGMSVTAQIAALIRGALGSDEPVTITATSSASMGAVTWEKDRDKAIIDLADQIGAWVYFDRTGEAIVADVPTSGRSTTWLADASLTGVLTELTRERSRTDTFNVVVVASSSTDSEKFPTQIVWDDNPLSPTYAGTDPMNAPETAGPFGIVVDYLDTPNLATAGEAQAAGLARLARGQGLAMQVSLGQVPNPAVDAFDSIDVLPPPETFNTSRVLERHVADTVTHPLSLGTAQHIEGRSVQVSS
jgi:hypothetical protein